MGDPPSYRRYRELAANRWDLPSAATLRRRLGLWSAIAAVLTEQRARKCHRPAKPVQALVTDGHRAVTDAASPDGTSEEKDGWRLERLLSPLGVKALEYLAEHPGSSGREVKRGLGIRHGSQAWTLLDRLERDGLLVKQRLGLHNAWTLTQQGAAVLAELPEELHASA